MNNMKLKCKGGPIWNCTRPAIVGLLISFAVTALLIAIFSLFFVIMESIAESATVPLALISAAVGSFLGAYICGAMIKCRGIIFGAAVGFALFLIICVVGLFGSDQLFGTETAIKFILLTAAGCLGGYLGGKRKKRRK